MHSKVAQKKQLAKKPSSDNVPPAGFITQVKKDDEQNIVKVSSISHLYKCCSYFFKCLSRKKQQNFSQIPEQSNALLEPQLPEHRGKKVLVLDLDETLVHSTFEPVTNPDLILPVRIQGMTYRINVIKRPGVEEFLEHVGDLFEVVIFTASLAEYAEPLVRILDTTNAVSSLLYRQHCTPLNGVYVKDMSLLGRDMKDIILVDNSPNSFLFQPENAYHIKNFFDDKTDRELIRLSNFLDRIAEVDDVRPIEELRRRYEPTPGMNKLMKFVKVNSNQPPQQEDPVELEEIAALQVQETPKTNTSKKEKNSREDEGKAYNVETEPDLRKDDREEEFQEYRPGQSYRGNKLINGLFARNGPLTERIMSNDPDSSEIIENIELPSPKESDTLINYREADGFLDNNSSDPDTKESKAGAKQRPKIPPFLKSASAIFNKLNAEGELVTINDPTVEGHRVEDVRLLTGLGNLNSPLGRHVKIEIPTAHGHVHKANNENDSDQ
jgi:RNA polymerase II subunit A small phosphatase-like protein